MALTLRSSLLRFFCVAAAWVIVARAAAQDARAKDAPVNEPPAKGKFHHAVLIRFEGVILPSLREHLFRKLDVAKEDGADLVILEIESPGGMVSETFKIVERLQDMDTEGIHTVAYVPREAISGAAVVALACDEILIAPGARLGDVGAIVLGKDSMWHHAPEKVISDLAARMRTLAEATKRPPALMEAMVDMKLKVFRVRNQKGEIEYRSQRELDERPGEWQTLGAVAGTGDGRFLTVLGADAVTLGLAQGPASSRTDLKDRYGLDDLPVLQATAVDKVIDILNSPWVTGLLLVIGLIALYVELMAPGIGAGALIAAVCFVVFFWSHFLGGTAGWLEVVLFLLGVVFLAVELFVLPGFMVAGIAGVALILVSVVMAVQSFLIPQTPRQLQMLTNTLLMMMLAGVGFAVAATVLGRRFGGLGLFRHLTLAPPGPAAAGSGAAGTLPLEGFAPPPVGPGEVGVAQSYLRPGGKARFGDHYVDVLTEGDFVPSGTPIRVLRISGSQVVVEEVK